MILNNSRKSQKVLLIGGAGFIGFNLAQYISDHFDYEITIADNLFRGRMDEHLSL